MLKLLLELRFSNLKLLPVFLFSITTTILVAQQPNNWQQVLPLPPEPQIIADFEGVIRSSIAFADVDGDNDSDVLITGLNLSSQPIAKLYANDGAGNFTLVIGTPFDGVQNSSVAFTDVDGDNDPDVLITGLNSSFQPIAKLYTNDGTGSFTLVPGTPFEGVHDSSIAFADVDGDNDPDVLITGNNSSSQPIAKLYTNDGTGSFTLVAGTLFEGVYYSSVAFADVDGDNDPDVLITGFNSSSQPIAKLYTNDGAGSFTLVAGTLFEGVYYSSVVFADVDNDNDPDVLITGLNSSYQQIAKLYSNDGAGSFTLVVGTPFDGVYSSSIAFADVDGDSDPDVLITGNSSGGQITKLYTNDGTGSFTLVVGTPFDGVHSSSIAFADVDGDSDPDVLITGDNLSNLRIAKLYTNNGTGNFTLAAGTPFEGAYDGSIAFADVDGDSDPDVLITGRDPDNQPITKLYTNDGVGNFTLVTGTPFVGVYISSIAFEDVDGDNDPDALITGVNSSNQSIAKLYINDGTGSFTLVAGTPFEGVYDSSIAFADVDGDSDPDVLITGFNSSSQPIAKLYTNDGAGSFTLVAGTPFEGAHDSSIAFADVDGDNDPDVLITGFNSSSQPIAELYTNDGAGSFTLVAGSPFDGVRSSSIAFADVDGDNDSDVLITGHSSSQPIAKLYTNDGAGNFILVPGTFFEGVYYSSVAFADVDNDSDPDVLITGLNSSNQSIVKLYTNDGAGSFTFVAGTPFNWVSSSSVAFADVNDDYFTDVLIAGYGANGPTAKLYRNLNVPCTDAMLTENISACSTYTWRDGVIYTSSQVGITYTVADAVAPGCDSVYTLNLTIGDLIAPVPDVATLPNLVDECSVTPAFPTATDNCAGVLTGTPDITFPITIQGTTVVTWTFDDGNGNTTTQTQNVNITDVTAPVADAATLADVTDECAVTSLNAPTATDNCAGVLTGTPDITFPITTQGTTVVTWTFDDGNGNTTTQIQNVIITDVTAPVADAATLPDLTETCSVNMPSAPLATDNCSGAITGTTNTSFPITTPGTTVITWTYTDANGNVSTQTQNAIITGVAVTTSVSGLTITADNSAGTYAWLNCTDNTLIPNETAQSYTAVENGSYAVIVTENGCTDTSACVQINTVGLEGLNVANLVLYPNPSSNGMFYIQYDGEIRHIEAIDLRGRGVQLGIESSGKLIDASALAPGKYILRIETEHAPIIKEIVLTH